MRQSARDEVDNDQQNAVDNGIEQANGRCVGEITATGFHTYFIYIGGNDFRVSSHITSDLEKVADYIVFIHQGKVIFSLPKDTLLYQYGILRCRTEEFNQIDKGDILAYQKKDFEWEVLVADKEKAAQKYRKCVIDNATIDEIMLLYIKGVQQCAG